MSEQSDESVESIESIEIKEEELNDTEEVKQLKSKVYEMLFLENRRLDDSLEAAYSKNPFDYDLLQFNGDYVDDIVYPEECSELVRNQVDKLHSEYTQKQYQRYPGFDIKYCNKTIGERLIAHKFDLTLLDIVYNIYDLIIKNIDRENDNMKPLIDGLVHDYDYVDDGIKGLTCLITALESYLKYEDIMNTVAQKYNLTELLAT